MIKAVVFDCFGVIYTSAVTVAFDELGGNQLDDTSFYHDALRLRSLGKLGREEMAQVIADGLGATVAKWNAHVDAHKGRDERMMKLIKELRSNYKTGLMSNIGRDSVASYFPPPEQDEYFDVVIASADVGIIKPDPAIYELAMKGLDLPAEQILFTDDNPRFVEVAQELGMKGITFKDYTQFKRELQEMLDA